MKGRKSGEQLLRDLPATFTYRQAIQIGISDRWLSRLRDLGLVELVGRGLYRRNDVEETSADQFADVNLLEIAHKAPQATLCMITALAHHGLIDDIPIALDIALPRGLRHPVTSAPVIWHSFNPTTFDIGRGELELTTNISIGIYGQQRCLIDAFRLAHQVGTDVATAALKQWLRHPDGTPAELMEMAQQFPAAVRGLHQALVTLL